MKSVRHSLKHSSNPDKYNYITAPKWSGYRGIHEVFIHEPRPHRKGEDVAKPWRGLLCEVQYRTRIQHAWATALEISDLIDGERTKFATTADKTNARIHFFCLVSELLARHHENIPNALPNYTTDDIRREIIESEKHLNIISSLKALKTVDDHQKIGKHNVLNIIKDENGLPALEIIPFNNATDAISKSQYLENQPTSLNAVYVASDRPSELRRAYKNYFNDPVDFVALVEAALQAAPQQ